jgi:NAD(P)-dependent dehydrogenase (short-subunit alcohol dehydrogenase family)
MTMRLLDAALDRLILPGYSRIGYAVRRRYWPPDPPPGALAGGHALVTGAGSGLGEAAAIGLARLGAQVHLLVRDRHRGGTALDRVRGAVPDAQLQLEICDLSSLAAVREFGTDFRARVPELRVLVHNAGVLPARREVTQDGYELTFATHVLGPFLLTRMLAGTLSAGARVIWVSSGGMYSQRLPTADLQYMHGRYRGAVAYARTKRMQVVLAGGWAQRLRDAEVGVYAMHPGWVDTAGLANSLPGFHRLARPLLRTAEQGADTTVWLAATPTRPVGLFWHDRRERPPHYRKGTQDTYEERQLLWSVCQQFTEPYFSAPMNR